MIRQPLTIFCKGDTLAATLDLPRQHDAATTGLLIVTGGSEIRSGAWNGQSRLAARAAEAGYPVLRFDRRGVGDSEGENSGFIGSNADITAAIAAFRAACPHLTRLVAWGNCDAASALMLAAAAGAGADALILSNPWSFDTVIEASGIEDLGGEALGGEAPASATLPAEAPPQALRAYYRQRLANPVALAGLLLGKVSLARLAGSLLATLRRAAPASQLSAQMATSLAHFTGPVSILLAGRDRTAQSFLAQWNKRDPRLRHCPRASHSFVEPEAREWLFGEVLKVLKA